ncbi:Uncharacterized protein FWK35_00003229 [Aphis craccivora]|uniref:Uncharacterized protein n=1 Tax=Aphis craccivora TaxID=307492 RepID=A0A6G0ZNN0_APHCR|nr:Uncharacterized protein FWK35_00003229 [Aphis craccivora]
MIIKLRIILLQPPTLWTVQTIGTKLRHDRSDSLNDSKLMRRKRKLYYDKSCKVGARIMVPISTHAQFILIDENLEFTTATFSIFFLSSTKHLKNFETIRKNFIIRAHSERSDECIDFTMMCVSFFVCVPVYKITSRNNAPISNFRGDFRCKSEYPWCNKEVKMSMTLENLIQVFLVVAKKKLKIKSVENAKNHKNCCYKSWILENFTMSIKFFWPKILENLVQCSPSAQLLFLF